MLDATNKLDGTVEVDETYAAARGAADAVRAQDPRGVALVQRGGGMPSAGCKKREPEDAADDYTDQARARRFALACRIEAGFL
jgi:hypothetical protein